MTNITKDLVMTALNTLIYSYTFGNVDHFSCPLCKLYKEPDSINLCRTCPNTVFNTPNSKYPIGCTQRCVDYEYLSYLKISDEKNSAKVIANNHKPLAEFWTEVRSLFDISHPDDVVALTDELKSEILKIAKKYL